MSQVSCLKSRRGFTLVEVVLVTLVLTLLLVEAIPKFDRTFQRLRAEQIAFEFTQLLRYAHERAVSQGEVIVVRWDVQARRAALRLLPQPERPDERPDCAQARTPLAPSVEGSTVPPDISIQMIRENQADDCVSFFPDGTSEPMTLHVAHDALNYTVTVDASTSQVLLSAGPAAR